jgi:hypothetical protein
MCSAQMFKLLNSIFHAVSLAAVSHQHASRLLQPAKLGVEACVCVDVLSRRDVLSRNIDVVQLHIPYCIPSACKLVVPAQLATAASRR